VKKIEKIVYYLIVVEFGHPYTIFDYNVLVGNFGK